MHTSKRGRLVRSLAAAAGAALMMAPALAMAGDGHDAGAPVKLADAELDQVTGGDGALLDVPINANILLKDISVIVNVSNVPINAGVAVQANILGSAAQTATVQALQSVQQIQAIGAMPTP